MKFTGDGVLATFDGPGRAIRCACAIRDGVESLGLEMRAGLHAGEIELRGDDVSGIAVHTAQRVSSLAGAGEVFVSRTVADLLAGSDSTSTSTANTNSRAYREPGNCSESSSNNDRP